MVLVVSVGDPRLAHRGLVLAVKGDGGGVVMDTTRVQLELFDDVEGEPKEEALRPR